MIERPAALFDREIEWTELNRFASAGQGAPSIGLVLGRRRQGKSFLLDRLSTGVGGLRYQALEETRGSSLSGLYGASAAWQGFSGPADGRFKDWREALRSIADAAGGRLIVLDEFPYLLRESPELPSAIQAAYDEARFGRHPWFRLILCGSALSVMSQLLLGTKALRGRASLQLMVTAFDFRQARAYWRIHDPRVAFLVDAVVGGAPGYRDLLHGQVPASTDDFADWLASSALNPSHTLFHEADLLLTEDPTLADRALYASIVASIAKGHATKGGVASDLGRKESSLDHPLGQLERAGFILRDHDLLRPNRPLLRVADPILRFSYAIVRRALPRFAGRDTHAAWVDATARFDSLVLGPHFEAMARTWTARYASERTLGGPIRRVGFAQVNDPILRQSFELDVVVEGETETGQPQLIAIGEAKGGAAVRTMGDLERLRRLRDALGRRADVSLAKLLLFGRSGFAPDVLQVGRDHPDIELVDLRRLYEGD